MHVPSSIAILLLHLVSITARPSHPEVVHRSNASKKCCFAGYAFNEDLECVHEESDKFNYTTHDAWRTIAQHPQQITTLITSVQGLNCRDNEEDDSNSQHHPYLPRIYSIFRAPRDYCIENMINGTTVLIKCAETGVSEVTRDRENSTETTVVMKTTTTTTTMMTTIITVTTITTITTVSMTNVSSKENETQVVHHCSDLRNVFFWGTQTYMDTNVAHVVLTIIVVVVYLSVPQLARSIYNRAVLRHNVCLLLQGSLLTFLGYCNLCGISMSDNLETFLWVLMQYFTNATVFWLNVICFDMALSITRFRWMISSGKQTNQEENRRLRLYGVFAWGGAFLPAVVAIILEFCPGIPEDLPFKPNYRRYHDGPNYVVNLYFFGLPMLTLLLNNVLFVFTTYKIIRIQQSTEIATRNQSNALRKKYFLFLQLYLLMGAPWFFGLLFACMNKLVVMKICRLIWPILWLLMFATHKKQRRKLVNLLTLRCVKKKPEIIAIS
ncbi:MTH2 protein, partial [Acromyrmex charruanus]